MKVLLVDDSLTVRMDLSEAFTTAGFEVIACGTIAEARDALHEAPQAAVLDVQLPDGDGFQLLREIRRNELPVRVLMLSSEAEVGDRLRGMQTGADEYVGKPYDRTYVIAKTRELLQGPAAQAPILLIDDSMTYRMALRDAFAEAGYKVETASGGEDGLKKAHLLRPRAIVVDGSMPDMDGMDVIRRVRLDAALRTTPCLMLTGSDDSGAELRALDHGADGFVRKEEDMPVILAKLRAALRTRVTGTDGARMTRKVLVFDDVLVPALRAEGLDVTVARSTDVHGLQVDCVVVDSISLCQSVKAALPEVPVIARCTDTVAVLMAGADDCVAPTVDLGILMARVRTQLRRKQADDEARAAHEQAVEARFAKELEEKNRELEAFSYTVSHDLRAPLRAVDGFAHMLQEDYGDKLDETGQRYLQRMLAGTQRMSELIEDMLELARLSRTPLVKTAVDLSACAREVCADLQARDPARQIDFEITPNVIVQGDARLLRAVLENLLGNAWKFTAKKPQAHIIFGDCFVRDNGAGFDMRFADKLFGPFQRLHSAEEFEGTGIGLATVKRIVTRHGGRVWAESVVGQGTTIYFSLP